MFGTNDDSQQSNDDPAMLDNVKQLASEPAQAVEPTQQFAATTVTSDPVATTSDPVTTSVIPEPSVPDFSATHTAEPAQGFSSSPMPDPVTPPTPPEPTTVPEPVADDLSQVPSSDPVADASSTQPSIQPADPDYLADMKQEALGHLEPLVEHLEGTPEETFKTTMMMIQANDNHTLLEKALDAAKLIEDDKIRAQAMLDIVNEINYFSQNQA